ALECSGSHQTSVGAERMEVWRLPLRPNANRSSQRTNLLEVDDKRPDNRGQAVANVAERREEGKSPTRVRPAGVTGRDVAPGTGFPRPRRAGNAVAVSE